MAWSAPQPRAQHGRSVRRSGARLSAACWAVSSAAAGAKASCTMSSSRAHARDAYIGVACVLAGSIGFSGKTVIVKLAYQYGVDAMTLLALRMLFALPFFLIMAWVAGGTAMTRRDWSAVAALGFIGYYLGSYLDFAG